MNERLKVIRKELGLNQKGMGERINLSQTHISSLENGTREVTDRIIHDLVRELNVNEDWLRTGEGEMFEQPKTFSLDEKARQFNLTRLEIEIMRNYMELDKDIRESIINMVKRSVDAVEEKEDIKIEYELTSYQKELESVKKVADEDKSSAYGTTKEKREPM